MRSFWPRALSALALSAVLAFAPDPASAMGTHSGSHRSHRYSSSGQGVTSVEGLSPPVELGWLRAVYPVPASSGITVRALVPREGAANLQVFSVGGRLVKTSTIIGAALTEVESQIRVTDLPSGVYFLRYSSPSGLIVRRWPWGVLVVR